MHNRFSASPKKIQRKFSQKCSFAWHSPPKQSKILQMSTSYISQLKSIKKDQLQKGKYKKARLSLQKIHKIQESVKQVKKRRLSLQHSRQKQVLKIAYQKEANYFNRQWKTYFVKQQKRQIKAIKNFSVWERIVKNSSNQKVQKKYLNEIKIKKNSFKKEKDKLRFNKILNHNCIVSPQRPSKKQLQNIKKELFQFSESVRKRLEIVQQRRQSKNISKKYKALMQKIQVNKNQRQRVFLRQQMRLHKKYKNVLRILKHEQKMEINWLHSINQI